MQAAQQGVSLSHLVNRKLANPNATRAAGSAEEAIAKQRALFRLLRKKAGKTDWVSFVREERRELVAKNRITIYDAQYLALAQKLQCKAGDL